jgi:hypothetical protein
LTLIEIVYGDDFVFDGLGGSLVKLLLFFLVFSDLTILFLIISFHFHGGG